MAKGYLNRVGFRATSSGTGAFVVASALTGMQKPEDALSPAVVNGGTYNYFAESDDRTQWEFGVGAYNTGTDTLTRASVLENSSGGTTALSFSAAPKVFMGGPLAHDMNITAGRYVLLTSFSLDTAFGDWGITTYDGSNDPHMQYFYIDPTNVLTTLDLSNCLSLRSVSVGFSSTIADIDLSGDLNLESVRLQAGVTVDLTGCVSLTFFRGQFSGITDVDFSDCIALETVNIYGTAGGTPVLSSAANPALVSVVYSGTYAMTGTLDLSGCTALTTVSGGAAVGPTTLDLSGCTALTSLDLSDSTNTATVSLSGCSALAASILLVNMTDLVSLDLTGCTAMSDINGSGCTALTTVTIPTPIPGDSFYMTGAALTQASVNAILVSLDSFGHSNGSVAINGGSSAAPSGAGSAAKTSLLGKGWTVTTN